MDNRSKPQCKFSFFLTLASLKLAALLFCVSADPNSLIDYPPYYPSDIPIGERVPNRDTIIENLRAYIQPFSHCTIYITNYLGINIPDNIIWPMVLLRYFARPNSQDSYNSDDWRLFPVELADRENYTDFKWSMFLEYILPIENKMAAARQQCVTQIYVYPPYPQDSYGDKPQNPLIDRMLIGILLPVWLYDHFFDAPWMKSVVKSLPEYHIHIGKAVVPDKRAILYGNSVWVGQLHDSVKTQATTKRYIFEWISYSKNVRTTTLYGETREQILFVYYQTNLKDCANVDQRIQIHQAHYNTVLLQVAEIDEKKEILPRNDMVYEKWNENTEIRNPDYRSIKQLLKLTMHLQLSETRSFGTRLKLYLSSLLETNTSRKATCRGVGMIQLQTWASNIEFQYMGMGHHKKQLRLLVCAEFVKSSWTPILEIFAGFDTGIWISLILISASVTLWVTLVTPYANIATYFAINCNAKSRFWQLFVRSSLHIYGTFVEQGTVLFQKRDCRRSQLLRFVLFPVPVAFLLLSNFYKGENIGRLTAPPALIPVDTINKSVAANVNIYTAPVDISDLNQIHNHKQLNGHEAFPVVSQVRDFLYRKASRILGYREKFKLMEVPSHFQVYWNNSKLFPHWTYIEDTDNVTELIYKLMIPHLQPCKTSAVITTENIAHVLYHNLAMAKKPVYLAQDSVVEYFEGYRMNSLISDWYFKRIKYFFESGIAVWWYNYVTFASTQAKLLSIAENGQTKKNQSLLIFSVPIGGVILALVVFLFVDRPISINFRSFSRTYEHQMSTPNNLVRKFVLQYLGKLKEPGVPIQIFRLNPVSFQSTRPDSRKSKTEC